MKNRIELLARVTLARILLDALGIRLTLASHKFEEKKQSILKQNLTI